MSDGMSEGQQWTQELRRTTAWLNTLTDHIGGPTEATRLQLLVMAESTHLFLAPEGRDAASYDRRSAVERSLRLLENADREEWARILYQAAFADQGAFTRLKNFSPFRGAKVVFFNRTGQTAFVTGDVDELLPTAAGEDLWNKACAAVIQNDGASTFFPFKT